MHLLQFRGALAAVTLFASSALAGTTVRYVDASLASGANNGSSWADAFQGVGGVAAAIAASGSGDQVWVRAGTYKPTTGTTRTIAFTLKNGVAIYGGFAGGETQLAERDPAANVTILSGDLLGNDQPGGVNVSDNSYHVVNAASQGATAVLDGFTVTGGNANGASASNQDKGGGILCLSSSNVTIRACRFEANRCTFGGGAGYINASSPTFTDCRFTGNLGGSFGGAFDMATNCNPTFRNCWFESNQAARAGAVEVFGNSQPKLTNCVFWKNTATGSNGGGAMWIGSSSFATVRQCTFVANVATLLAGGIINTGGTSTVANCIFWKNTGPGGTTAANQIASSGGTTTVTYCVVQGGFAGTGNTSADPLFMNEAGGDFHLQGGASPAIDAGNNASIPAGVTTDFDGKPRVVANPCVADSGAGAAPFVDRGAFESQGVPCAADLDGNAEVNGADLGLLVGNWGNAGTGDINQDGTVNGADLGALIGGWGSCCQ